jgi:hypothetical protein
MRFRRRLSGLATPKDRHRSPPRRPPRHEEHPCLNMALRVGGFVESLGPIRAIPFHGAAYTAGTSAHRPPGSPDGPLAWAEMGWSHPGDRHLPPVLRPMLKPGCRPIAPYGLISLTIPAGADRPRCHSGLTPPLPRAGPPTHEPTGQPVSGTTYAARSSARRPLSATFRFSTGTTWITKAKADPRPPMAPAPNAMSHPLAGAIVQWATS